MNLADFVFALIVAMTLAGAFLAVWLKNVFYNALSLIVCLFGVACLFIYLNSEFLAVMEVIVYIGAISVAIIFAIMLSRPMFQKHEKRNPVKLLTGFALAATLFWILSKVIVNTQWPTESLEGDYSIRAIGHTLLGAHILPFEVISVVLLVAIIGAIVIANREGSAR